MYVFKVDSSFNNHFTLFFKLPYYNGKLLLKLTCLREKKIFMCSRNQPALYELWRLCCCEQESWWYKVEHRERIFAWKTAGWSQKVSVWLLYCLMVKWDGEYYCCFQQEERKGSLSSWWSENRARHREADLSPQPSGIDVKNCLIQLPDWNQSTMNHQNAWTTFTEFLNRNQI